MNEALRLILVFGTLSLLGFGGGKGIFPQMRIDAVDQYHWLTAEHFAQFYTIGKLVPGPTTIMCALVGYSALGFAGAAIAAAAMFVPSSLLMAIVATLWDRWKGSPVRDLIVKGLAPCIVGLVWASGYVMGKGAITNLAEVAIALAIAALSLRTTLAAPLLILGAGIAGAIFLR